MILVGLMRRRERVRLIGRWRKLFFFFSLYSFSQKYRREFILALYTLDSHLGQGTSDEELAISNIA